MTEDAESLPVSRIQALSGVIDDMRMYAERSYSMMQIGKRPMGDACLRFLLTTQLMRELAEICADNLARGVDFALARELIVLPHRAKYLREKLARMLGEQTLRGLCVLWMRHEPAAPNHGAPPTRRLVSSVDVEVMGNHERVRVWNRGGLAGELVVCSGDGELLASVLLGGGGHAEAG